MKTRHYLLAIALLSLNGPVVADFKSTLFRCDHLTSTIDGGCPGIIREKVNGPFNFGLWNNREYDIKTIWVRAEINGEDKWTEINKHTGTLPRSGGSSSGANSVVFEFNDQWLLDKLQVEDTNLKNGFKFRLKIKSVGFGSGREAKCHPAQVKYDFDNQRWLWRKDHNSASWHVIGDHTIYMWKVHGTVNNVSCALKDVGGETVN